MARENPENAAYQNFIKDLNDILGSININKLNLS